MNADQVEAIFGRDGFLLTEAGELQFLHVTGNRVVSLDSVGLATACGFVAHVARLDTVPDSVNDALRHGAA